MVNELKPENYSWDRRGKATVVVTQALPNYIKIRLLRVIQKRSRFQVIVSVTVRNKKKKKTPHEHAV